MRVTCGHLSGVVLGLAGLAACSSPPPPATVTPQAEARPAGGVGGPQLPTALTVSSVPAELSVSGQRIASQALTVSYTMSEPELVSKATLQLYVPEIGVLSTMDVPAQAQATVQFAIDPKEHSLGSTVRFRATCPNGGTTDWYTMGQIPLGYPENMADIFRIASVTPNSIPWHPAMGEGQSAAGQRLKIFGPRITADCKIEAQVNGSTIELNNVLFLNQRFEGLLMFRDINFNSVSPRHAELKLNIIRQGRRIGAITRMAFGES